MPKIKAEFDTPRFHWIVEAQSIEDLIIKLDGLLKQGSVREAEVTDPAKEKKSRYRRQVVISGYPDVVSQNKRQTVPQNCWQNDPEEVRGYAYQAVHPRFKIS